LLLDIGFIEIDVGFNDGLIVAGIDDFLDLLLGHG